MEVLLAILIGSIPLKNISPSSHTFSQYALVFHFVAIISHIQPKGFHYDIEVMLTISIFIITDYKSIIPEYLYLLNCRIHRYLLYYYPLYSHSV